jgi:hypothetical protein
MKIFYKIAMVVLILAASTAFGQVVSGGSYVLERTVTAGGGGASLGGDYKIEGTAGQHAAGTTSFGGVYSTRSGFWANTLAPTAATISISGRVLTLNGLGLTNAQVTLQGGRLTSPRISLTGGFGYFSFDGIEAGQTYVITVTSKRFGFAQSSQTVSAVDDVTDIDFQAGWML